MTSPDRASKPIEILAGSYFDSYNGVFLKDHSITVCPERGIILDVRPISSNDAASLLKDDVQENVIDLRTQFVLPGFVDAHVHFFLHPYTETSWEDQLTRESLVERTVRAVTHARRTLLAGFTTVRDLGTEGAGDADISLRKCVSGADALIPGPRYFCANRALVVTGSYGPKGVLHLHTEGVDGITGAEVVDGVDECRKAVRRQIGAGADWIKMYADQSIRSRLQPVAPSLAQRPLPTFTPTELRETIATAARLGAKTALHLNEDATLTAILAAAPASPDAPDAGRPHSIEHGATLSTANLTALRDRRIFWVPTLAAYHTLGGAHWAAAQETFRRALLVDGLKIACGGDTGVFPHGENARELQLMARLGASPEQILRWATLRGWECVRGLQWEGSDGVARLQRIPRLEGDWAQRARDNDTPFGAIRKGFAADIIATSLDPTKRFAEAVDAANITFVMKGGRVYKRDGKAVC